MTTLENEKLSHGESFALADLVSFGNYLLSQDREDMVSELNKRNVTHADIENWRESIVNR